MTIYTGTEGDDDFVITTFIGFGDEFLGLGGQDTLVVGTNPGIPFYSFSAAVLSSIEHLEFVNASGVAAFANFSLASHPFTGPGNTITGSAGLNNVYFVTTEGGDFTVPTLTLVNWTPTTPLEYIGLVAQTTAAVTLRANETLESAQLLTGGGGNDTLIGHSGLDQLTGGAGSDVLLGLSGDDIIYVANNNLLPNGDLDQSGDTVDGGIGEDILSVAGPVIAGTLSSVEHILFMAAGGLAGAPELILHTSRNASFLANANFVGTVGGAVTLNFDTVDNFDGSGITFEDQVFNGTLVESDLQVFFSFLGNDNANTIVGTSRSDSITGNGGNDQLHGGLGDDSYYVETQADLVFESADQGTDTVFSSSNYYLYANIEDLVIFGPGDLFGVGNALGNTITGNDGANLILGGEGNDTIGAWTGNDTVYGEAGDDTLYGEYGVDYLIGGIGHDTLYGGEDSDALYGEDGNDTLWAGATFDADILIGGAGDDALHGDSGLNEQDFLDGDAGDDSYYVDTTWDLTFEDEDGGIDTVFADVSNVPNSGVYLWGNVENLVLVGTTAFGVGNALGNNLIGSSSANWLLGGAGNDTLDGKAGDDVLFGEAGGDIFFFQQGTGGDVIGDFNAAEDQINLDAFNFSSFAQLQTAFIQNGAHGAINLGNGDFIVLHNVTMSTLNAGDFVL